jgi:CheY-like chemotaxis protein
MEMSQKILVIDDSKDMRVLLSLLLKPEGYEVAEACDGKQALKMLKTETAPDLIFLDHNMSVMDGPEFLEILEKKFPKIFATVPVIMLTGMESEKITASRATEVVAKQAGIEPLLRLVAKYLH